MGRPLTRLAVLVALAAAAAIYGASLPGRDARACGSGGPFDFDTYELEQYVARYNTAIDLAVEGKAVTSVLSVGGEQVDVRYQGLVKGSRAERTTTADTSLRVPPSIYKSIVWVESNWSNGSGSVPWGGVGPVLRSFDCGYGLGQVTSGMANNSGSPTAKQAVVGTHLLFNIAEGVRILADKWNSAPKYRPIAGNGDPAALEDWYYAIWSYNGFAFSNHPLNPDRDPLRGGGEASPVYHCYDPSAPSYQTTSSGGLMFGYGDFTYPERVYGCMRYPPSTPDGQQGWTPPAQPPPVPGAPKFEVGEVALIRVDDCVNLRPTPGKEQAPKGCLANGMEVTVLGGPVAAEDLVWWNVRSALYGDGWVAESFLVKKSAPAQGPRMWMPQEFAMPNLTIPLVAAAFQPANFEACEDAGFAGGCPAMDFPTSIPEQGVETHTDGTPAANPTAAATFLGSPVLSFAGATEANLVAYVDGVVTSTTVTVKNTGTWIGPFRVRSSVPWLVARHAGDSSTRTVDGGVAIGNETEVVTQKATASKPRVAQAGYESVLLVTLDAATMPTGTHQATLWIEPLLGGGAPFVLTVSATNHGAPKPGTTPTPVQGNRAIAPGLSADR
ncbi:MAG: SH3 domain-containing protein [Chloroflexi bacterium CFX7]|nr:SH3 domain-containing protein [Chloroflexi bacterium CFX7]RIL01958.1 MAG: hypothetical protein DCC78_08940 [bacterium]